MEMINNILIEVFATLAEKEHVDIRKQQREGIEAANRQCVIFERSHKELPASWPADYTTWKAGKAPAVSLYKNMV